jgi:hypothetical protein
MSPRLTSWWWLVWMVIQGMTVAHDHPAAERTVKYVKPDPTPPAMS